jgi:hypothetical protein
LKRIAQEDTFQAKMSAFNDIQQMSAFDDTLPQTPQAHKPNFLQIWVMCKE